MCVEGEEKLWVLFSIGLKTERLFHCLVLLVKLINKSMQLQHDMWYGCIASASRYVMIRDYPDTTVFGRRPKSMMHTIIMLLRPGRCLQQHCMQHSDEGFEASQFAVALTLHVRAWEHMWWNICYQSVSKILGPECCHETWVKMQQMTSPLFPFLISMVKKSRYVVCGNP